MNEKPRKHLLSIYLIMDLHLEYILKPNKNIHNLIRNKQKIRIDTSPKKTCRYRQTHEKMFHFTRP